MRKRLDISEEMNAALEAIAAEEYRDVNNQILYILHHYIREKGVVVAPPKPEPTPIVFTVSEFGPPKPIEEAVPEPVPAREDGFSTEQAIAADAIEDTEARKKAQVSAVLEAWKTLFPTARRLVHTRAANWIGQRWDSAAEVVDVFLNVAERVAAGKVEVQPSFDNYVAKAIPPTEPRKLPVQTPYTNPDWERGPTREEIERENEEAKLLYEQYGNTWRQQWGIADADGRGSD